MMLLAAKPKSWPQRSMAVEKDTEASDRRRKGLALKAVRRRLGFTQEAAASAYKVTTQAWQNYEAGKRHLSDPKIRELLAALNSDREEFDLELARIPEDEPRGRARGGSEERPFEPFRLPIGGVAHGGASRPDLYDPQAEAEVIDLSRFFTPDTEALRLGGMSMFPYAEPGGFVTFNRRDLAKRGDGCVIEKLDGSKLVKRFDYFTDDSLVVTELWPEERQLTFPLAEIRGVYAIGMRFS